tara:strand:- start:15727 stop:16119 length:393 start_codon:yes stop_codon:yes gene_type:complete
MRKIIEGTVDLSSLCLTELLDLSDVEVTGHFYCNHNNLTNLKGAPKTVKGNVDCMINDLVSLEGAPQTIDGSFNCEENKLTNIEDLPKTINRNLVLDISLKKNFNEEYIRSRCKIRGTVHFADLNIEVDE